MSTLFSIFNTIQYKLFPWLEEELAGYPHLAFEKNKKSITIPSKF